MVWVCCFVWFWFFKILEISQDKKRAHQLLCKWEETSASGKVLSGILGWISVGFTFHEIQTEGQYTCPLKWQWGESWGSKTTKCQVLVSVVRLRNEFTLNSGCTPEVRPRLCKAPKLLCSLISWEFDVLIMTRDRSLCSKWPTIFKIFKWWKSKNQI